MTLEDVKDAVSSVAPLLGSLFGPLGTVAGTLVSSALGVENKPDAIMEAIKTDPQAALKLREAESSNKLELQKAVIQAGTAKIVEDTKQMLAVNATMQAEVSHGGFSGFWRPFWGVISGTAFGVVAIFICFLGYQAVLGGKPEALAMIPQLISAMAMLFAIPGAILGVTAYQRGKMQRAQAGELIQKGLIGSVISKIRK